MTSGRTGRQPGNDADTKKKAAREKVARLRRALTDAESVLTRAAQEMARVGQPPARPARPRRESPPPDAQAATSPVSDYFSRVMDVMGEEGRRLSEQVQALTEAIQRLERRLDDLPRLVVPGGPPEMPPPEAPSEAALPEAPVAEAPPEEKEEPAEPQFAAGGEGIQLLVSAVPGFQGLMEVQRALTHMPAVEGASVERYLDGEARISLLLREPLTARRIADGLAEYIGERLTIEEARPEALRLHLRFGGGET
jgi:hypothetical protein